MKPSILFRSTYCNSASGVSPRELEQRYLEALEPEIAHILSARFSGSLSGNATLQTQLPADLGNAVTRPRGFSA